MQKIASIPRFMALPEHGAEAAGPGRVRVLTAAMRAGDAAAFSCFYEAYGFRVYKYLLAISRGEENVAREVFQSVMLKMARRFEVFEDEEALWAWLRRVARNAFLDHCRAQRRLDRFVPLMEPPAESGCGAEAGLHEALKRALAEFAPEERELLSAAYVDGRALRELADAGGDTYKAVESRLARLRQKLKTRLLNQLRHEEGI